MATFQELQRLISKLRVKMAEQTDQLKQLTASPNGYATVVVTGSRTVEQEPVLKEGARVRAQVRVYSDTDPYGDDIETHELVVERFDPRDNGIHVLGNGNMPTQWVAMKDYELLPLPPIETAYVVVIADDKLLEVEQPPNLKLEPGNVVRLSVATMQIIGLAEGLAIGELVVVKRLVDDDLSEVDYQGSSRVVFNGGNAVKQGDQVVLDQAAGLVIVRNLGTLDETFQVATSHDVAWSDVGGLEDAKTALIGAIELPYQQPEIFAHYGKKQPKGILLYGPPGCGKTMLGRAVATSLRKQYGGSAGDGFLYIKAPELLNRYVGVTEAAIRAIFARARKFKEDYGYPAVIFFDEIDALGRTRGTGVSTDIGDTIVPTLLTEMDGLEESGALVIFATNRAERLDPALTRDDRIDLKVKVERPTMGTSVDIFRLYLEATPIVGVHSTHELGKEAGEFLFSAEHVLYDVLLRSDNTLEFTLGELCSGAMIKGIVEKAKAFAMARDLERDILTGVMLEDLRRAVRATLKENIDLDNESAVAEFVNGFHSDIVSISKRPLVAA